MTTAALAAAPTPVDEFKVVPIERLSESPTNPRKRFAGLEELAASIRQVGLLEPLLVRTSPRSPTGGSYEIIAGARRFRAAQLVGLEELPVIVRQLSDREALEAQIVENLQRQDVHPLDEADGYHALMAADPAYTVDAVAARVGRSPSYVYQRLRLLKLIPAAREAFEHDEITAAHAVRLARLAPADQERAFDECFYPLFGRRGIDGREVAPVSRLDRWIEDHTKVDVAEPDVVKHYLPELHEQLTAAEETEPAASLLQLSDAHAPGASLGDKKHGLIGRGRWKEVRSEKACPHVQRGVVVHGGPLRVLKVCATRGCPKHWPATPKTPAAAKPTAAADPYKEQQEKWARERQLFDKLKPRVLHALAVKLRGTELTESLLRGVVDALSAGDGLSRLEDAVLEAGYRIGVDHAGAVLQLAIADGDLWNYDALRKVAKQHGIDLKAIEKALADEAGEEEAVEPARKSGAKKKRRRRRS